MAENGTPTATPGTEQPQDAEYWRQQAIAQEQRHNQLQAQYQKDMEQVYNVLTAQQQAAQPQAAQPQAPPQPEWDVTDPKQLKQNVESSLQNAMRQTMTPVVLALAQNQYESHMLNAKRDERMPYFATWEQEIRQLAQGVQPGLLAEYNTLVNLYQLVASRHAGELVELEVRKRLAQQQEAQHADEVEIEEDAPSEQQVPLSPPPRQQQSLSMPPHPSPPPAAPIQSMQPARSTRTGGVRRLTREEAYMAQQMGMSLREYAEAKNLGDYDL